MEKIRTLVVCPGRGTYNKEELGYLQQRHNDKKDALSFIDDYRTAAGKSTVTELDNMPRYSMKLHTRGENASPLIYACALADFLSINQNNFQIVATTGNSMGWYIALAIAGAVEQNEAIRLIDTMGSMMNTGLTGGQVIYPYVDTQWQEITGKKHQILNRIDQINRTPSAECYLSIDLGGYLVVAGNEEGLKAFEEEVPKIENRFPLRLFNHAAFHTPMLRSVSQQALLKLADLPFQKPSIPLIDGRGKIWSPYSSDHSKIKDYTLGHQVTKPYDFAKAIEVSLKEFSPDKIIVLGPGTTLGSSVAQTLIKLNWQGINSKQAFVEQQQTDPLIISMGMESQAALCQ